jgi:hypothetical protein
VTPEGQPVPPRLAAGLAIQFVINGNGTLIHCSPQSAAAGGINVTAGPVTVDDAHRSATGGQAVQADRDATVARAEDQPCKEGWWARLRERGMVVAIATIVGAFAAIVGTAVAICAWVGWTP